jgi:hypothetical protein
MGETYYIGRERLEMMRLEQRRRDAMAWKAPPLKATAEPAEYVPPAKAKPLAVAMGLLMHELAVKAMPVATLTAKAAKLGVSESTLRRAKKACAISTIEREDGFYWDLTARLTG